MPELPEVETVVRTLRPKLIGRAVSGVELDRADILEPGGSDLVAALKGRAIVGIDRRGKRILIRLGGGTTLGVHLGMTGRLTVGPAGEEVRKHTHLRVDLNDGAQLRFRDPRRFGGLLLLGAGDSHDVHMGPEALEIRPAQLAHNLARTRRAIKTALLDQSIIAGLGNIYVDESLYLAGIYPMLPANRLEPAQIKRLNRAIKTVLRRAIRHRGSSLRDYVDAEGRPGDFQKMHRVYDRAGEKCGACRGTIERVVLGGRSTHFCPRCQRQ